MLYPQTKSPWAYWELGVTWFLLNLPKTLGHLVAPNTLALVPPPVKLGDRYMS